MTREYLLGTAYRYLERFATTEKNLRLILERKARRRLYMSETGDSESDLGAAKIWIEEIVRSAVEKNLVNDRQYAIARARALYRSGNSKSLIVRKLLARGVPDALAGDVMAELAQENEGLERLAAIRYIKKRRFGAFSIREGEGEKQLAALCRAGFSYALAREVLKMSRDELEEMLYCGNDF